MSNDIILHIKLYGCLRKYNVTESLTLNAVAGETVSQIKNRLITLLTNMTHDFNDNKLIEVSALAHSHMILSENQKIYSNGELAVLPPVCGG